MPKETVYGADFPYGSHDDPGSARAVVEVRWDRETSYFQMATRCVDAATGETYRGPETAEDETDVPELTFADGFYVGLDRRGINTLIRNLRRARDQAFGRDE